VDGQPLFMHFYQLEEQGANKAQVLETINKFITDKKQAKNAEGK